MHQRGDLTRDSQLIYLSQWLGEFSEVEKDDFLQQLLDVYAPGQLAIGQRLAPLKSESKLPTLFDCRIDLFKEWFASWESADRDELLERLKEADAEFMGRFQKSKETPNEDKIVEEFWLRLDNGSSQETETKHTIPGTLENGTSSIQENGTGSIQENGTATIQENGTSLIQENGTANIRENGASTVQENGSADGLDRVSDSFRQIVSIPSVEISSPVSEISEAESVEPAPNPATPTTEEPAGVKSDEEKAKPEDESKEAVENEHQ